MPDKKHLKLEDLLGNDQEPPAQSDDPAQQQLADAVQRMITNAGNETWETADKDRLWQEIAAGLVPKPFVYRYLFLKIAASVLVLLAAASWLLWPRPPHSLVRFAQQQHLDTATDTD